MRGYSPFSPIDIKITSAEEGLIYLNELMDNKKHVLLVATRNTIKRCKLDKWLDAFINGEKNLWVNNIPSNPGVADVVSTLKDLTTYKIDTILSIGGGSCIDLAKAISALKNSVNNYYINTETIREVIKTKCYSTNPQGRMDNNPILFTRDDVKEILSCIFNNNASIRNLGNGTKSR